MTRFRRPASARRSGPEDLKAAGIRTVRLQYADLHGINRGQGHPDRRVPARGRGGDRLRRGGHDRGPEPQRDRRLRARVPGPAGASRTSRRWCGCRGSRTWPGASPTSPTRTPASRTRWTPAAALRRCSASSAQLDLAPVLGPELEFYLCEPDPKAPRGYRHYADQCQPRLHRGRHRRPARRPAAHARGQSTSASARSPRRTSTAARSTRSTCATAPALDSADRAFRFKALVKEIAAREGLLATFMGKPFNDDEGSGFHLHVSLCDDGRRERLRRPVRRRRAAPVARHFIAGLIEHSPAIMVFFNPTVNAYRRITPEALVPTRASWGHDHRMVLVRVPNERGAADADRAAPRRRHGEPVPGAARRRSPRGSTASAAGSSRRRRSRA